MRVSRGHDHRQKPVAARPLGLYFMLLGAKSPPALSVVIRKGAAGRPPLGIVQRGRCSCPKTRFSMLKNVGNADRVIRLLAAALFVWLFFNGTVTGVFGVVLLVLSLVFTLTALFGTCPIYLFLGVSTCRFDPKKNHK